MKPRVIVFLLLLAILLLSSVSARSRTWYIKPDGTGDAPTIQAGVDSSSAGDTVLVAPGTYSDTFQMMIDSELKTVNISINKNIMLISEGSPANTIIDGSNSDIAIYVENVESTAEIQGFMVFTTIVGWICPLPAKESSIHGNEGPVAIKCKYSSIAITNNEIKDNLIAIELFQSPAKVADNVIYYSNFGIACCDSSNADIRNNTIHDGAYLIMCDSSCPRIVNNILYGNQIIYSCHGIASFNSAPLIVGNNIYDFINAGIFCWGGNPIIEDNWIVSFVRAVELQSNPSPIVRRNYLSAKDIAVKMLGVSGGTIEKNTITDSPTGFFAEGGSSPLIQNNIIVRASSGVWCTPSSFPSMYCNDMFNVTNPYDSNCSDQTGINGNIIIDPEFCGMEGSGNYYLQSDSPCAPGNHPDGENCGLIGALPVACDSVATEKKSWGSIKAIYKK